MDQGFIGMMVNNGLQRSKRAKIINGLYLIFFALYVFRLFDLQVFQGTLYKDLSDQNRVRQIPVYPPRGIVFDRNEKILIGNRPSYSLYLVPYEFHRNPIEAELGLHLLGMDFNQIQEVIKHQNGGPFSPVRLKRDMDFLALSVIEENRLDLPGFYYTIEPVRTFPQPIRASHVLGYIGEVGHRQLKKLKTEGYQSGDCIGKNGIERYYEQLLRGHKGYQYREVDVRGREVGNFGGRRDIRSKAGKDLMLTLDSDIQQKAEELFQGSRGSVIVMNPQNGEILAMVSKPDFNLAPFSTGLSIQMWESLLQDIQKPLLNRSTQAQFEPGSLFKLVLAITALEDRLINIDESYYCHGTFHLGKRPFLCWKKEGHGDMNLLDALQGSCNVFFYQLGLSIGVERIFYYGNQLGLGRKTGIDLEEETPGLLPNIRYLNQKYGKQKWTKGMVVNLSIGQGDLLVTPVQMIRMACMIGSEEQFYEPHLLRAIRDHDELWRYVQYENKQIHTVSKKTLQMIKEGLFRVVNGEGGTGRLARLRHIPVCGKTGTAQNPQGKPHAWFLGFAPMHQPTAAVVVVLENGGSGGQHAAPIAGTIFQKIFSEELSL